MKRTRFVFQVAVMVAVAVRAMPAQGQGSPPLTARLGLEGGVQYQRFSDDLASQTGPGLGYEGQVRYFAYGWSIGVGVDYVQHEKQYVTLVGSPATVVTRASDANFTGLFVEPRLPLGGPRSPVRPYLALRAGMGRAKPLVNLGTDAEPDLVETSVTSYTWNAGFGVALQLAGPVSLDVALNGGVVKWNSNDENLFPGSVVGNGDTSTGNFTARGGLSFRFR
jgi:hypothetical protein